MGKLNKLWGVAVRGLFVLVLAQLAAACARGEPDLAPGWSLEVLRAEALAEGGGSLCAPDCGPCKAVHVGEQLRAPARLDTAPASELTLGLTGDGALVLGQSTAVSLEREPLRAVVLRTGRLTLRLGRAGDGARGRERPVLRLGGHTVLAPADRPVTLAALADGPARAALTVLRGRVLVLASGRKPKVMLAGQSARLQPGLPPDLGAVYRGEMAAVEPIESGWLSSRAEAVGAAPSPRGGLRGVGRLTARVPGTTAEISGVRLVDHRVEVIIRDGLARTEIVEEFQNDTGRVLEGRYLFAVPPGASISRLALWVGDELVEGEMLERDRAARIFKGIVDDSVRPRDPALLEQRGASTVSLRIFPIMPGKTRRVLLAYNQALAVEGGWVRYRYPLPHGEARVARLERFAIALSLDEPSARIDQVRVPLYPVRVQTEPHHLTARLERAGLVPPADFVLAYHLAGAGPLGAQGAQLHTAVYRGGGGGGDGSGLERSAGAERSAFVALRVPVSLPDGEMVPPPAGHERVLVVDGSHAQGPRALALALLLVRGLLQRMGDDERFAVLVCDTACSGYPEQGLLPAAEPFISQAMARMEAARSGGASDVGGALIEGAARLGSGDGGQLVYFGDGAVTAGERSVERIAALLSPRIDAGKIDLRLVELGRSVDRSTLAAIAAGAGGSTLALPGGLPFEAMVERLALGLRAPVLRRPTLELPGGAVEREPRLRGGLGQQAPDLQKDRWAAEPEALPNLPVGQELLVVARLGQLRGGHVVLRGKLGSRPYRVRYELPAPAPSAEDNPLIPRLWAKRRIAALDRLDEPAARAEVVALSKEHHVLSRHTALLVLENESMFAAYGIARTQRRSGAGASPPRRALGRSAAGGLWGQPIARASSLTGASGSAAGAGGLRLGGVGAGGGGRGDRRDAADFGVRGLLGGASGRRQAEAGVAQWGSSTLREDGRGAGFGAGNGRLARGHRARPPRVRMGATSVSGRLPPEIIQRIVRQNFGRFRVCYERGLRRHPGLSGRVVVRFVIGQSGAVSSVSGGGDLPDAEVVGCVSRAFLALSFPAVTGGIVTVSYPIVFTPAAGERRGVDAPREPSRSAPPPPGLPSAAPRRPAPLPLSVHLVSNDGWRQRGGAALERLRAAVVDSPNSRTTRRALVRGLLRRGHFIEALAQAQRLGRDDPDWPVAQELLAQARAATGRRALAAQALSSEVELSPDSAPLQRRAARAFEAVSDERRACAHWRAAAALDPKRVASLYQAVRCRARLHLGPAGDADTLHAAHATSPSLRRRVSSLLGGHAPVFADAAAPVGWFRAKLRCQAKRCPALIVLTPTGQVVSSVTPTAARAGASEVALQWRRSGTYRTLLVGRLQGGTAEIELRADGAIRRFEVGPHQADEPFTVAATEVRRGYVWY